MAPASAHPDAELLRTWRDWQVATRAALDAEPERDPAGDLFRPMWQIERRIKAIRARTFAGLAVKLRIILSDWSVEAGDDVQEALATGRPISPPRWLATSPARWSCPGCTTASGWQPRKGPPHDEADTTPLPARPGSAPDTRSGGGQ